MRVWQTTPRHVRFESIDTPERGQPFGNNATEFVKARCIGKQVTVLVTGSDKYKRDLGYVLANGNVNADLVAAGLAWVYRDYSDDAELIRAELNARTNEQGLWRDVRRVAPWDWRKLNKEEKNKLRYSLSIKLNYFGGSMNNYLHENDRTFFD